MRDITGWACLETLPSMSDHVTQLRSIQLEQMRHLTSNIYVTTPAYASHCNPVEKTNRTIKTMISQFVEKDQRM